MTIIKAYWPQLLLAWIFVNAAIATLLLIGADRRLRQRKRPPPAELWAIHHRPHWD